MKRNQAIGLVEQLNRIRGDLELFARPEAKAAFVRGLDELIARLHKIRSHVSSPSVGAKLSEAQRPLEQVIDLLERAKTDELLSVLLADAIEIKKAKQKRVPIDIPSDLSNDQIRGLLAQSLSRQELKAIAAQRGISAGKAPDDEVKRVVLRALARQEGYERLASPRATSE